MCCAHNCLALFHTDSNISIVLQFWSHQANDPRAFVSLLLLSPSFPPSTHSLESLTSGAGASPSIAHPGSPRPPLALSDSALPSMMAQRYGSPLFPSAGVAISQRHHCHRPLLDSAIYGRLQAKDLPELSHAHRTALGLSTDSTRALGLNPRDHMTGACAGICGHCTLK